MGRFSKFFRLPAAEKRLLFRALFLVSLIRLGLTFIPFPALLRTVNRMAAASSKARKGDYVSRISWAVAAVSRLVPKASCLTQALSVQVLLGRAGERSSLRIGVAPANEGGLDAHAWVESQGRVVIGNSNLGRYTLLPAIEME